MAPVTVNGNGVVASAGSCPDPERAGRGRRRRKVRQRRRGGAGDGRRGRGREAARDRVPPVDPEQASGEERNEGSGGIDPDPGKRGREWSAWGVRASG